MVQSLLWKLVSPATPPDFLSFFPKLGEGRGRGDDGDGGGGGEGAEAFQGPEAVVESPEAKLPSGMVSIYARDAKT